MDQKKLFTDTGSLALWRKILCSSPLSCFITVAFCLKGEENPGKYKEEWQIWSRRMQWLGLRRNTYYFKNGEQRGLELGWKRRREKGSDYKWWFWGIIHDVEMDSQQSDGKGLFLHCMFIFFISLLPWNPGKHSCRLFHLDLTTTLKGWSSWKMVSPVKHCCWGGIWTQIFFVHSSQMVIHSVSKLAS